jgi:hypothetical protein
MRLPRFRFRTLLIAAVVAAVVLGATVEVVRLIKLAQAYQDKANHCAWLAEKSRTLANGFERRALIDQSAHTIVAAENWRTKAEYDSRMAEILREAARRPWLPLPPFPPPPK